MLLFIRIYIKDSSSVSSCQSLFVGMSTPITKNYSIQYFGFVCFSELLVILSVYLSAHFSIEYSADRK